MNYDQLHDEIYTHYSRTASLLDVLTSHRFRLRRRADGSVTATLGGAESPNGIHALIPYRRRGATWKNLLPFVRAMQRAVSTRAQED